MPDPSFDSMAAPEARIGFLLYRVGLAVSRSFERRLKPLDAKPVQTGVLNVLAAKGPESVRGLGRALGVNRQTIVNVSDELAARGWLTKRVDAGDRRAVTIAITAKGRAALAELDKVAVAFERDLARILPVTRLKPLFEDLRALAESDLLSDNEQ